MKIELLEKAICNIDDDLIDAANRDAVQTKTSRLKWLSCAVAACIAVTAAVIALPMMNRDAAPQTSSDIAATGTQTGTDTVTDTARDTVTDKSGGECEAGGTDGKINMSVKYSVTGFDFYLGNEEAYAFLASVGDGIRSLLGSFGVETEGFRISRTGYSHLRTGDSGNSMAVNWRDFIAYDDNGIVAVITVAKDEEGLHYYPVWGSPGFEEYGAFLSENRGEELVYLWVGDVEAVITPENKIFCLADISDSITEEEADSYYSFFKTAENTYIPE